jgi:hypothetical protein
VFDGGSVQVELLDKDNGEIAVGEPVKQTVTDAEVKWANGFSLEQLKGNEIKLKLDLRDVRLESGWKDQAYFSSLKGKVVRLRFTMQNAKLYAFQIR